MKKHNVTDVAHILLIVDHAGQVHSNVITKPDFMSHPTDLYNSLHSDGILCLAEYLPDHDTSVWDVDRFRPTGDHVEAMQTHARERLIDYRNYL